MNLGSPKSYSWYFYHKNLRNENNQLSLNKLGWYRMAKPRDIFLLISLFSLVCSLVNFSAGNWSYGIVFMICAIMFAVLYKKVSQHEFSFDL